MIGKWVLMCDISISVESISKKNARKILMLSKKTVRRALKKSSNVEYYQRQHLQTWKPHFLLNFILGNQHGILDRLI